MNKARGSDGIPAELFQILKDDTVKELHSICQQIWKTQQWPQDWKRSVFIPIPKKSNVKEYSNYCTIALISHASKVSSKSSKVVFNSTWTKNFQIYKLDLEKADEPETKLPTSVGSSKNEKAWEFQKNICFCFIGYTKAFDYVDHSKLWKILKEMGYKTTLPAFREVKKQQLELDVEQWTGSKLGKEYVKAEYCHPAYLTCMPSTSCEMPGWMKHKLEPRLLGEISTISNMQIIPP